MNKRNQKILVDVIVVALIAAGLGWICSKFVYLGSSTYTDNAQVRRHIVAVNSKIQGFVKEVRFDEYAHVSKGDTLIIIEDAEFRLHLAQAEAGYRNSLVGKSAMHNSIATSRNNVAVSDAAIEEIKANLANAESNYKRYQSLYEKNAVTRQEFEGVETQYKALKARYEMMQRQQQTSRLVVSEQTTRLSQNDAGISVAEAALELAQLNLSYTVILAPCDGYTSAKDIQVGELVNPGRQLLSIVSDEECWVVANYREKQLSNINVGDKVRIRVDAVPGYDFTGTVSSVSAATGAQYSLVPQDNATGNFVKTEQRIPVKIDFAEGNDADKMAKLRSGFNVECKVLK